MGLWQRTAPEEQRFAADPLGWLDAFAHSAAGVAAIAPGKIAVGDPAVARAVLKNEAGLYIDHSDFFGNGATAFGPRAAQVEIGRGGAALALAHLRAAPIDRMLIELGPDPQWPRAGNALLERLTQGLLTGPHRSARFNQLRMAILSARILDREDPTGWATRLSRRFAFYRAFERERDDHRRLASPAMRDLLDMLFALGGHAPTETLIKLYVAFNFALVGSLGFALGWALLLALRSDAAHHPPRHILAETLRLYPIAWLLSRRVERAHAIGAMSLRPGDELWVFPYAVHRHPAHWAEPERFLPERWSARPDRTAWIPFGAGVHTCAAASLTFQVFETIWRRLHADFVLGLRDVGRASAIGPALVPPHFTLTMRPRG